MVMMGSLLEVADNTGVRLVKLISCIGNSVQRTPAIGQVVVVSVQEATSKSEIKAGAVHRAVLVRTRRVIMRDGGMTVRFDSNAVVLIQSNGDPSGSRISGAVPGIELKKAGQGRLLSLAQEVC